MMQMIMEMVAMDMGLVYGIVVIIRSKTAFLDMCGMQLRLLIKVGLMSVTALSQRLF